MVWLPAGNALVAQTATPEPLIATPLQAAIGLPLDVNVTVPVGVTVDGATGVTVAVNVTAPLTVEGFAELVTAVDELPLVTVCVNEPELAP